MNCERKIMAILLFLSAALTILFIVTGVGFSIEIDTCTPIGPLWNETDNSTYFINVCPQKCRVLLTNLSAGAAVNNSNGTCEVEVSVQNSMQLVPFQRVNFTLSSNSTFFYKTDFFEVDAKSEGFYCPACPEQRICKVNKTIDFVENVSYNWWVQDSSCDVNITVPPKPYCLSDDSDWLMNTTCVERGIMVSLLDTSNKTTQYEAELATYRKTWFPPEEACNNDPHSLIKRLKKLGSYAKEKIMYFSMGNGAYSVQSFKSVAFPSIKNEREDAQALVATQMILEEYVRAGIAIPACADQTDSVNPNLTIRKCYGYYSTLTAGCTNQTYLDGLSQLDKDASWVGFRNGAVVVLAGFSFLGGLKFIISWYNEVED